MDEKKEKERKELERNKNKREQSNTGNVLDTEKLSPKQEAQTTEVRRCKARLEKDDSVDTPDGYKEVTEIQHTVMTHITHLKD